MSNIPGKVSPYQLEWRLNNPPSPALCVVHSCTRPPLNAIAPMCAEHSRVVEEWGKKNKPTTATYRRRVWALVASGNAGN